MPVNTKHTAPLTIPAEIFSFNESTKFLNIQNTDAAINVRAGFTDVDLILSGIRIGPGETWPVPLDGSVGKVWIVSEAAALADKVILVRG